MREEDVEETTPMDRFLGRPAQASDPEPDARFIEAELPAAPRVTGRRVVAALIDMVPLTILGLGLSNRYGEFDTSGTFNFRLENGPFLLFLGVVVLYFVVAEGVTGASLGKWMMRLEVLSLDGSPLTWKATLIRNTLRLIDALPVFYLVGMVAVWSTRTNQRLGDLAASTVVAARDTSGISNWATAPPPEGGSPVSGGVTVPPGSQPSGIARAVIVAAVAVVTAVAGGTLLADDSRGESPGAPSENGAAVPPQFVNITEGDCIESFSVIGDSLGGTSEVATTPCEAAHDLEVSATLDVSETIKTYPGESAMESRAGVVCLEAFSNYVGIDAWDTNLTSGQIYPLSSSWVQGNRQVICLVHRRDQTRLEGSVRGRGDDLFVDLGRRADWQSVAVGECINNVPMFRFTGEYSVTDCAKLHEAEVYHVAEITAFGDDYPGDDRLRSYVRDECAGRVEDYVGGSLEAGLDTARFGPDELGWSIGDRNMICVVTDRTAGTRFSGSVARNE